MTETKRYTVTGDIDLDELIRDQPWFSDGTLWMKITADGDDYLTVEFPTEEMVKDVRK